MEKWIFVNNVTSLDKLYLLTKTISETEINKDNHAIKLMDALNQNGANRNEANNHPINYVLFYKMVYLDGDIYKTTNHGNYLINNYEKIVTDKKLCAEFFFNVLIEIEYPNDAVNTSKEYIVHPFKILFKILFDERLGKRITTEELSKYISIIKKEDDYEEFVKLLLSHRINNSSMPVCEEVAQVPTVVAGWINSFNVMKKEGNNIMISDELNLKLPNINISNEITSLPFTKKFISYALKKYLFDGMSRNKIDSTFYGTEKYNGMMSQLVIEYFGINNAKGIYNGIKFETVINFLKLQNNSKYLKLAKAIIDECDDDKKSNLDIFRKFYISNAEKKDLEVEEYILQDNKFMEEYPLDKILDFTIEDYKIYCYKLEYDKTTYKNIGFPVGAGGSKKYGFYHKKDGTYRDGNDEIIADENAEKYFNEFKTQLYDYLKEVEKSDNWIDPRDKYNLLAKTNYSNVWLQKIICSYFPEKVVNVYDKTMLIKIATYLDIPIDYNWYPGQISFEMNKWFRKNIQDTCEFHPFYIGNAIYKFFDESPKDDGQETTIDGFIPGGYNMIYYGTPGCGKSHKVNDEYDEENGFEKDLVHRVTFHPEYSNSDFVGQILPKTTPNEQVKYDFQPGPFSIALLDAFNNPDKKVCLIIEEINRGNASAIFGDIFQLLDRDELGKSIYEIDNEPIKKYLEENEIHIDKIFIPSNMWIIATMNTSDQNVFTLDTAFKRRWRMKRIPNKFDMSKDYDKKLSKMYIPGSSYTWEQFVDLVNAAIIKNNLTGLNSEDKQLGVYFVTENELSFTPLNQDKDIIDKFIEKVLLYIWDDVAKIDPTLWFNDNINSFDELVDEYFKNSLRVFKELFKDQQQTESQDYDEKNN